MEITKKMGNLFLGLLFIIFILFNFEIPYNLSTLIDTKIGIVIIVFILLLLVCYAHPIVTVLGFLTAYELIKRSSIKSGNNNLEKYYPIQQKKWSPYNMHNQFPVTLEQEIVSKMTKTPLNPTPTKASYLPILENNYNASSIH